MNYGLKTGLRQEPVMRLVGLGWTDEQIAGRYGCTRQSVWHVRERFNIPTTRPVVRYGIDQELPKDVERAWTKLLAGARR